MSRSQFVFQNMVLLCGIGILVAVFTTFYEWRSIVSIYVASSALFLGINIVLYISTILPTTIKNPYGFNNVIGASFLIKLVLSLAFLSIWKYKVSNQSEDHIIHFLLVYLIYTAHEVYFLTKLAKNQEVVKESVTK